MGTVRDPFSVGWSRTTLNASVAWVETFSRCSLPVWIQTRLLRRSFLFGLISSSRGGRDNLQRFGGI